MTLNIRARIKEVAATAGVSVATVSRVVNGKDSVREVTRRRVQKVIDELKYQPNLAASELKSGHSSFIGVVVPSVHNMFFGEVIEGIEDYLRQDVYSLLLNCAQNDPKREEDCIRALVNRGVSGIIVISPNTHNINENFYCEVVKQVPLVFINGYYHIPGACYVTNDEALGTEEALRHLFEFGHKKILFVRGTNSDSYEIKEITYRRVMKDKIDEIEKYIVNIGEGNGVHTVENTAYILEMFLRGSDATAIFCCNDLMGVGAINAVKRIDKKVPQDYSIIGFDNISISHFIEPRLTTMDQNMLQLGKNAANVLIDRINGGEVKRLTLYNSLIERDSTGRLIKN